MDFYKPRDDEAQQRANIGNLALSSGNHLVVRGLSGEYYRNLDLAIQPGSNTVIIGDNVEARQELIHDLAHAHELEGQTVQLPKNAKIEFVEPDSSAYDSEISLRNFFLESRDIAGVEERLAGLWDRAAEDPKALDEAGKLQEKFEQAGGWNVDREITFLLEGLRVASSRHDRITLDTKLGEMSSGQISKAIIGKALFSRAGIIIMDDPSVHLDVASKSWLADYVRTSKQATIIATSDMDFATEIGDRVVEILDSRLTLNIQTDVGNYYEERNKLLNHWTEEVERKKQAIEELKLHIRDFLRPAARRTDNMAQVLRANETKLKRMIAEYDEMPGKILLEAAKRQPKPRRFNERQRSGNNVFHMQDVNILYETDDALGEPTVIEVPKLDIYRKDKLAVIGSNGSGKSTLLRFLAGQTEGMLIEGQNKTGSAINTGYYSPYTQLDEADATLGNLLGKYTSNPMGILSYWGFNRPEYYDMTADKLVYRDEKARAQFALLMAKKPNVLLLDEPTSYLTPTYQERLLAAIKDYDGTLLMVSHDPHFLAQAKLGGRIVMPGGIREVN